MLGLFGSRAWPIALDLGSATIKMLQLSGGRGTCGVSAAGIYQLPAGLPPAMDAPEREAAVIDGVREIMKSAEFRGRRVAISLPDAAVQFKSVRMAAMERRQLAGAVRGEAAEQFQLTGELNIQHLCAGEVHQGGEMREEVILIAAAQSAIEQVMRIAEACELQVEAIEVTPTALARSFSRAFRREVDQSVPRAVVDIGAGATKVLVVRGWQILFYRHIEVAGATIDRAVAEALRLGLDEASSRRRQAMRDGNADPVIAKCAATVLGDVVREIGLCLRYCSVTFRGSRPEAVWLCGGESEDPLAARLLEQHLELPVHAFDPLAGMDLSDPGLSIERRNVAGAWAVATGLALRHRPAEPERGAA